MDEEKRPELLWIQVSCKGGFKEQDNQELHGNKCQCTWFIRTWGPARWQWRRTTSICWFCLPLRGDRRSTEKEEVRKTDTREGISKSSVDKRAAEKEHGEVADTRTGRARFRLYGKHDEDLSVESDRATAHRRNHRIGKSHVQYMPLYTIGETSARGIGIMRKGISNWEKLAQWAAEYDHSLHPSSRKTVGATGIHSVKGISNLNARFKDALL